MAVAGVAEDTTGAGLCVGEAWALAKAQRIPLATSTETVSRIMPHPHGIVMATSLDKGMVEPKIAGRREPCPLSLAFDPNDLAEPL